MQLSNMLAIQSQSRTPPTTCGSTVQIKLKLQHNSYPVHSFFEPLSHTCIVWAAPGSPAHSLVQHLVVSQQCCLFPAAVQPKLSCQLSPTTPAGMEVPWGYGDAKATVRASTFINNTAYRPYRKPYGGDGGAVLVLNRVQGEYVACFVA